MSGASARDVGVVIVAAGKGTRTGGAELKQFRWVAGKPMLLHSLQTFMQRPDVAMVVCVLPREYAGDPPPWIFQCDIDRLLVAAGGRERGDSVLAGLEDLPPEVTIVLVHDAARPFVEDAVIDRVIAAARNGEGAVPALPLRDTLKRASLEAASTPPCRARASGVRRPRRPSRARCSNARTAKHDRSACTPPMTPPSASASDSRCASSKGANAR